MFSYEYCKIFEKSFFQRTQRRWLLLAFTTTFPNYYWETFQLFSLLKPILAYDLEKQPYVFQKGIFKIFCKFGRKNLCWSLFLI